MKYQKIVNNKEINAYLKKGNSNLGQLGFTDKQTKPLTEVTYIKSYKTEPLYLCNM